MREVSLAYGKGSLRGGVPEGLAQQAVGGIPRDARVLWALAAQELWFE